MAASNDTIQGLSILRSIDENPDLRHFRTNIFPNHLAPIFDKSTNKKQGYTGIFNQVETTLLRPNLSFSFNGLMELAILEQEQSTIILTGEVLKSNLSHAHMYFQLPDNNPEEHANNIFRNIRKFFDTSVVNDDNLLKPLNDIDATFERKVIPLLQP